MSKQPMKSLVRCVPALALLLAAAVPALAQDALVAKRDAKLAESWVQKSAWVTDFDEARKTAKESGKLIFTYFTRSYAP